MIHVAFEKLHQGSVNNGYMPVQFSQSAVFTQYQSERVTITSCLSFGLYLELLFLSPCP